MEDRRGKSCLTLRRSLSNNLNTRPNPTSYTEENVPVYNVMIEKLPRNAKKALITQHFAKFGKIKDVEIKYGKTRSTTPQCIIYYQDTNGAGAALRQHYHSLNYQRLTVKACPSWEQPFQIEDTSSESVTTILSLNEYCLEMVYQQLDLQHQIRLSLCHPRLEQVFARMVCTRLKRHLNLTQLRDFSIWEIRQMFRTVGPNLQSLEIGSNFPKSSTAVSICEFMQEYCHHINSMKVVSRSFIHVSFLNAIKVANITELELYRCNLYDLDLKYFRHLTNLRSLGLAFNQHIQGQHLSRLRKVERLSLYKCQSVTSDAMLACCQALSLRYLDVRCTEHLQNLDSMIEYCGELEELRVSRITGVNTYNIVKLPKLKVLEVHHLFAALPTEFYHALAEYHANDLVELKLTGPTYTVFPVSAVCISRLCNLRVLWLGDNEFNVRKELLKLMANLTELEEINVNYSKHVRNDHLLPIIKQCTKLKRINIRHCRHITERLVWSAAKILQKRETGTPTQPLVMLVHGTRIHPEILKMQEYLNTCHLVKLLFHAKSPTRGFIREECVFDIRDDDVNDDLEDDEFNHAYGEEDVEYDDDDDYIMAYNAFADFFDEDDGDSDDMDIFFII